MSKALQEVARNRRVVLQWIPAHCGVPGDEQADELAKQGAREEQPENNSSYNEVCSLIGSLNTTSRTRDDYHLLTRKQQSVLVRLRTGHNRLNTYMSRKLKLVPSPTYLCNEADQTTEHILQECPLFEAKRADTWPEGQLLTTKLYGSHQTWKRRHFSSPELV